ncbi:hypothetical protein LTR27_011158 [Elasticomyces elasticus]|nr:hypothetical protein LTR27_011158 [Elasticomyces elasticus]
MKKAKEEAEKVEKRQEREREKAKAKESEGESAQAQGEPADAADEEIGRGSAESEKSTAESENSVVKFGAVQVSEADYDLIEKLKSSGKWADDEPAWSNLVMDPAAMKLQFSGAWAKLAKQYGLSEEQVAVSDAVTQMQLEALRQMYAETEHRVKQQQWLFFLQAGDQQRQLIEMAEAIVDVHGVAVTRKLLKAFEKKCDQVLGLSEEMQKQAAVFVRREQLTEKQLAVFQEVCKKLEDERLKQKTSHEEQCKKLEEERLKQKTSHEAEMKKLSRDRHQMHDRETVRQTEMEASNAAALQQERAAVAATCIDEIKATVTAYLGQHLGDVMTQAKQAVTSAMVDRFAGPVAAGVKQFMGSEDHLAIVTPLVGSAVKAALEGEKQEEGVVAKLRDTVTADVKQFMGTEAYLAMIEPVVSAAVAAALKAEKKDVVGEEDVSAKAFDHKTWLKQLEPRVEKLEEKVFNELEDKVLGLETHAPASAPSDVQLLLQQMEQRLEAKYDARLVEETAKVKEEMREAVRAEFDRQQISGGHSNAGVGQRGAYQSFGVRGNYNGGFRGDFNGAGRYH